MMVLKWSILVSFKNQRILTGENLEVVWANFSTLSWAVLFQRNVSAWPSLELKTRSRFHLISSGLSIQGILTKWESSVQ